jgi:hypothetical protein
MSLWTPGGEVPISRQPAQPEPEAPPSRPDSDEPDGQTLAGIDLENLTPEEREQAEQLLAEMAETQRRLAAMPAAEVVANHAMGLYELAAIHLSQPTPQLEDASIAIDAMQALVDAVGRRFGENERVLREALSNLQMAYVKLKGGDAPG